jgi:hypothetical protein
LRYSNNELPMLGDRIRNAKGGLGTVTNTSPVTNDPAEPLRITVKWDEGIIDIEYDLASKFTLISRSEVN